ncbi:BgTH12-07788 [Blumeria graminis f. sp. triticale]|uniref:BgTH12-07788 n=1 Tax=Blumeria graminis f. sp. triticale TaxID=1689686 RepID=A0A9W4DTQ8_BLUGR|nr:BgTH12-07788 [Blumeria graminis f. sp. triticale]
MIPGCVEVQAGELDASLHRANLHLRLSGFLGEWLCLGHVFLDDQAARVLGTQSLTALERQLVGKFEPASPLDHFQRNLELGDGFRVGNASIGQHKGAKSNGARRRTVLGKDDFVKVGGDGDVGRVTDDFVVDPPLSVGCVLLGQIQGAGDDADRGVALGQASAKVLEVGPIIAIEALADLRAHVAEVEGIVHGWLGPLGVGRRHLVTAVVARARVVTQLAAELLRHIFVLEKGTRLAIARRYGQRVGSQVFGDPEGISRASIVGRDESMAMRHVRHRAGEAILKETGRIYR